MKIFNLENLVPICMLVLFIGTSILSIRQDEWRSTLSEQCYTEAKDNETASKDCFQLFIAADSAVTAARLSMAPVLILFLGWLTLVTLKVRRLEAENKILKDKLDA